MALRKVTELARRAVDARGCINVAVDTVVMDADAELSRRRHVHTLAPGDSLKGQHPAVVRLAKAEWTPAVKKAWAARVKAAEAARDAQHLRAVRKSNKPNKGE